MLSISKATILNYIPESQTSSTLCCKTFPSKSLATTCASRLKNSGSISWNPLSHGLFVIGSELALSMLSKATSNNSRLSDFKVHFLFVCKRFMFVTFCRLLTCWMLFTDLRLWKLARQNSNLARAAKIDGNWQSYYGKITKSEMGQNLQASARNSIDESQPLLIVDTRLRNDSKNRRQFSTNDESFKCSYNGLGSLAHNLTFKWTTILGMSFVFKMKLYAISLTFARLQSIM